MCDNVPFHETLLSTRREEHARIQQNRGESAVQIAMAENRKRGKMLQYRLKSRASLRNDFGRLRNNGMEKNEKEEGISGLEQLG
jgi:hypothetical protein